MQFICIMGISGSGKSTVEAYLEKMGFTRSISYTTREPQVRDGKLEENGKEYKFVSEEQFFKLVDNGKIIEYEKYADHYYGTPRPYGSTRFVSVVCVGGYKALKNIFGNQVLGVYLKCDPKIANARGESRDTDPEQARKRNEKTLALMDEMEEAADIIIDSSTDTNSTLAEILKELQKRRV